MPVHARRSWGSPFEYWCNTPNVVGMRGSTYFGDITCAECQRALRSAGSGRLFPPPVYDDDEFGIREAVKEFMKGAKL